jgi:hypothetical protein
MDKWNEQELTEDDRRFIENHKKNLIVGFKEDFRVFLQKAHPQTFNDLVLLLAIYFSLKDHARPEFNKIALPLAPFGVQDPIIDDILAESKGYLIWVYQLEKIFGLFERDTDKIKTLVRDFRRSIAYANEWVSSQSLTENKCLKEIIEERMLLGQVWAPVKTYAALRLHRLLFAGEPALANISNES